MELLDLIARWVHVIAGIMWVGNSMLFNWLDRSLVARPGDAMSYGDIWLLHSGAFYDVEKNRGRRKPSSNTQHPLHWFKWQAYTTWLSGAALLVIVYYWGGRALLVDPAVNDIAPRTGVFIAVGTIVGGFVLYEAIWRFLGDRFPRASFVLTLLLVTQIVELLIATLSGRAAWVHTGAALATIMAGNVAFTIMPSQRELVSALEEGRAPSQAIADRAKTRSIHNNYITFPVIALMLSAHFPSLYAGEYTDLTLFTIIAGGAAVRHVLNIRFHFAQWKPTLAAVIAVAVVLLVLLAGDFRIGGSRAALPTPQFSGDSVPFAVARQIIERRCVTCHSASPSDVSLGVTPAGVSFDSARTIVAFMPRIRERAVVTMTMPPGNKTRMTDQERAILAQWIATQEPR
jgi:uncharacterized membrane protein